LTEAVPPLAYINYEQAQIQAQLGSAVLIVKTGGTRARWSPPFARRCGPCIQGRPPRFARWPT
jgi:hypothetical protein